MVTYIPDSKRMVHSTSVDFNADTVSRPVKIRQYDSAIPILAVELLKDGEYYTLTETAKANIRFSKKDSTYIYTPAVGCSEDRHILYFEITQNMSANCGCFFPIVEVVEDIESYILTTTKPTNWESDYMNYYTRSGEEGSYVYTNVPQGSTAPNWVVSKYYYKTNSGFAGSSSIKLEIFRNPVQNEDIESSTESGSLEELINSRIDGKVDKYQGTEYSGSLLRVDDNGVVYLASTVNTITESASDDTIPTSGAVRLKIEGITNLIPDQASSDNKLADKDFVNSSISTNTANYISDNGQPFSSVSSLPTGSNITNNDYAFVTGTDSYGNVYFDRYKASVNGSSVTWAKEYRLNNSSFTAEQWAAITSGITSSKVAEISNKVSKKTTAGTHVYGHQGNSELELTLTSNPAVAYGIGQRDGNRNLKTNAPVADNDCVPKSYSDDMFRGKTYTKTFDDGRPVGFHIVDDVNGPIMDAINGILTFSSLGVPGEKLEIHSSNIAYTDVNDGHVSITPENLLKGDRIYLNNTWYTIRTSSTDAGANGYITIVLED